MPSGKQGEYEPLIYGENPDNGLVAVEHVEGRNGKDEIVLFVRKNGETTQERVPFEPYLVVSSAAIANSPSKCRLVTLQGSDLLDSVAYFPSWKDLVKARSEISKVSKAAGDFGGCLFLNDPVHQYLVQSGRTLFKGMLFDELRRMQVDIECITTEGYEFCNAERPGDAIVAIGLSDQTGWMEVLSATDLSEKEMIQKFVKIVRERDPDVIEGHNIFNFDLPYLTERAAYHKVKLALGRDGSSPYSRPSQFNAAERTLAYQRFDIMGRHVVDTLLLAHAYDVSHRAFSGFGLKEVAIHLGVARPGRVYIEGSQISKEFQSNPQRVLQYLRDDVAETAALSAILSMSSFAQAQILPYSYQNVCVRGNATKIDALMLREYLRQGHSVPVPAQAREFEGGYTDIFAEGVLKNVHHCDIRSLYPSLMLLYRICPSNDSLNVFLKLLEHLRSFRLDAKKKMVASSSDSERNYYDALQSTFKILINSFYGYLGFSQARFNDFAAAEKVTFEGRSLLKSMIEWLEKAGAKPVEIDTDGIYFVPPDVGSAKEMDAFREKFAGLLPKGIEVEFDGEYVSMFSYKMKNYALLTAKGEVIIKGAALKSRGLEPFQRAFLKEMIRMKLEGKDRDIPVLKDRYEKAIRNREWPIAELAKTEVLQEAPSVYSGKRSGGKRARSAVYELAIASGREYRAGDQISYYVTGDSKSVAVHEKARLVSEWNPANRDENVAYYLAKLEALYEKFTDNDAQGEFEL